MSEFKLSLSGKGADELKVQWSSGPTDRQVFSCEFFASPEVQVVYDTSKWTPSLVQCDDGLVIRWRRILREEKPPTRDVFPHPKLSDNKLRELEALAEQGDVNTQYELGVRYTEGRGVTPDYAQAVRWYRLAAEQGRAEAQYDLGRMYANGRGVTQDDAQAVRWYRLAAEQGRAEAQYDLGVSYDNGRGVTQDDAQAVRWYRLAAEQGRAEAQYNLGRMYANGRGVTQDDAQAANWYHLAAEQGIAVAQNDFAVMYANGRGVAQDDVQAHMWFNLAAAQGNENSVMGRDMVENRMTAADIARAQRMARQWRPGQ